MYKDLCPSILSYESQPLAELLYQNHIAVLVVNYGISNTIVSEIP